MKLDPAQQKQITDDAAQAASDTVTKNLTKTANDAADAAAKTEVDSKLKTAFGVTTVSLDEISTKLKAKLLDDVIEQEDTAAVKATPQAEAKPHTHRYTIHVPDEGEQSVLNLGRGDTGRDLPDAGISARTKSHIHFHTTDGSTSSYVALGGKQTAPRKGLIDFKGVLAANTGIGAVTNGHFWAEAQGQLNLASHTNQAVLRSHIDKVRVQADGANVEIGAGKNVVVGGVENVNIVANGGVNVGDNAYGSGFDEALVEKSFIIAAKDGVTALDIVTACQSVIGAIKTTDLVYEKGKITKEEKKNDAHKTIVDGAKAISSITRFLLGKALNGQVKIAAETFASMSGMLGASVYGHLSASVTSMLSASVVGGTASVKGLKWASVWAKSGVSVRTAKGSASLKSDTGKVSINGHEEVNVASVGGVNMGGDKYAELKSMSGHVFIGAPQTKVCAGRADGMGLLLDGTTAFLGTVSKSDEASSARAETSFVSVDNGKKPLVEIRGTKAVVIKTNGTFMTFQGNKVSCSGKKIHFE